MERKASDLFVECLEVEGVKYVFGIPGEETLDLNESLANSSVDFVPVRHEQGGAYMADMYGRLTQRAGVCLGTLGPGATNLVTGIADAFLDRSPLVALTGQGDLERMHKESHQYIDIVSLMKPVTKWNARAERPAHHPRGRAQGVQGRAGPEARPDPHRAARGRDGGDGRRRAAARAHEHPQPRALRAGAAEGRRGHPLGDQPRRAGRQRRRARRRGGGAARVRARHRDRRGGDVHGQGAARLRGPALARDGRAAVARLRARGLRGRRRRDHGRLRPRRALPGATGTPRRTRRSSASTPPRSRSTSTS